MPIEPVTGSALVAAGASVANGVSQVAANTMSQKKWEKRQDYLEQQQQRAEKRQFDYNMQLQDYAFQKNLEQWNAENAYNSPSAQMARFRAAGLNANLLYGDSGGALAASSPQMSIGEVGSGTSNVAPYSELPALGGDFSHAAEIGVNALLSKAQIDKLKAETLSTLSDVDFKDASFDLRLENAAADLANTVADTENKTADTESKNLANDLNIQLNPIKVEQANEDLKNTKKQGFNLDKMGKLLDAQVGKTNLESALLRVQKEIAEYDRQIKKVDADNADVLMDLRKKRENAVIRFTNKQSRILDKELQYYDRKALAELSLSAAETLNRTSFAGLADARKDYQAFQNKLNEILLDPTKSTDARTYFSALLLKNLSETSFLDIMKYVSSEIDLDDVSPNLPKDDKPHEVTKEELNEYAKRLDPQKQQQFREWFDKHQNSTFSQRLEIVKQLLGE